VEVHALTFDVFGTLLDWRSTIVNAFRESRLEADPEELTDDWRARALAATQDVNQKQRPWAIFDRLHETTLGELLDGQAAIGAPVEMGKGGCPLAPRQRAEGELRCQLRDLGARDRGHVATDPSASRARSFSMPARMRVFAVPRGMPSSEAISLAVLP